MKICIAFLTFAFAFAVQAATISWLSENAIVDSTTGKALSSLDSGSIVLILLTDSTAAGSAWANGTWSAIKGSVTELQTATITESGRYKGHPSTDFGFTYGQTLENNDVIAAVFKDADGSYNQLTYYTDKSAVVDTLKISGLDNNTFSADFNFATAGNFMAVPEPTSGMLLLLGMVGLALKRKRA